MPPAQQPQLLFSGIIRNIPHFHHTVCRETPIRIVIPDIFERNEYLTTQIVNSRSEYKANGRNCSIHILNLEQYEQVGGKATSALTVCHMFTFSLPAGRFTPLIRLMCRLPFEFSALFQLISMYNTLQTKFSLGDLSIVLACFSDTVIW